MCLLFCSIFHNFFYFFNPNHFVLLCIYPIQYEFNPTFFILFLCITSHFLSTFFSIYPISYFNFLGAGPDVRVAASFYWEPLLLLLSRTGGTSHRQALFTSFKARFFFLFLRVKIIFTINICEKRNTH
jgi:hypothetical protein